MNRLSLVLGPLAGLLISPALAATSEVDGADVPADTPAAALLAVIEPPALRHLAAEALEADPGVARARHHAAAAAARAPQAASLPDPEATLTLFALPPETRVGPQRLNAAIRQRMPWFGTLALREQAALALAAAAEADVETMRLDVLAESRRLGYELAFHAAHEAIVRGERQTLARYEQTAQARYASGTGLQQESVRIQAEITRVDTRLLEIAEHHAALHAAINALRDLPAETPVPAIELPEPTGTPRFDGEALRRLARARRPELAAAVARAAARETGVELAEKRFRPDVTLGLAYTLVERRDDRAGRVMPPEGNGDDILALNGSLRLPVRKRSLEAGVEEARSAQWAAEEEHRQLLAGIEGAIGDLTARIPLLYDHWRLLERVLRVQAREALRSAETAYTTGKLNAVDLLDAEVVLFEVRIAAARTRTDLAVARAQLERAVAGPLTVGTSEPSDLSDVSDLSDSIPGGTDHEG